MFLFQNLTSLEDVIAGNNTILEISNCTSLEILNLPSTLQHVKLENIQSVVFKTEITEENCTTAGMETLEDSEIEFTPSSSMPTISTETRELTYPTLEFTQEAGNIEPVSSEPSDKLFFYLTIGLGSLCGLLIVCLVVLIIIYR